MKTIKTIISILLMATFLFSLHCKKNDGNSDSGTSTLQKESTPDLGVKKEDIYGKWMYNLKETGNTRDDFVSMYFCKNGYATYNHGYGGYVVYSWKLGEEGISFKKHNTCLAEEGTPSEKSCAKNHKTWRDQVPPTIKLENVKKAIAGQENVHKIKIERLKNFPKQCDPNFVPKSLEDLDEFIF